MPIKTPFARQDQPRPMRFLHHFSDSLLHTSLLVAIVLLASLTLYQAASSTLGLVWQLEPVLVHGQQAKR